MAHKPSPTSSEQQLERWLIATEAEIKADEGATSGVEPPESQDRCAHCGQFRGSEHTGHEG